MGDPQNIPVVMLAALIAQMPVLTWKEHGWPGVILGLAVAAGWKFTAWLAPHLNKLFEHFGAVLSGNVEMTQVLREQGIRQTEILTSINGRLDDHGDMLREIRDKGRPRRPIPNRSQTEGE